MKKKYFVKVSKSVLFFCCFLSLISACSDNPGKKDVPLPDVNMVNLEDIDPDLFNEEEWYMPYYLKHFSTVANSIVDTGENRGYINISVWRGIKNFHTYNARIMENILSLVWFYTTARPWNVYYKDPALQLKIEAALDFWCNVQNEDGRFSEYANERWSLAPTAFATKFVGRALWLLTKREPKIKEEVFERSCHALRKALYIGLTEEQLWEQGKKYTNQYANFWGGALMYLDICPDLEIKTLLKTRLKQSMTEFQSPVGFFYERGGPDWGYNLGTHHSDLQVAWEFAEGTEFEDMIVQKTKKWYDWFSYNALKEPGNNCYYLNHAIETRQHKSYYLYKDLTPNRGVPQAKFVPEAHSFLMSKKELEYAIYQAYEEMLEKYPEVKPLNVGGDFSAFSPYVFLHHNMKLWNPTEEQKEKAISNLPYLKYKNFTHVCHDSRSETTYSFVRRPNYYAIFNSGKIIADHQRYGLGMIWNPTMGTVIQSQSRTDIAAYGTKAKGDNHVYEGNDLIPKFMINKQDWLPEEGNYDLNDGDFIVSYDLKNKGKKVIHFYENRIVVQVEHSGKFTEILPLLITDKDVLIIENNQIKLQNKDAVMVINIKNGSDIESFMFEKDLIDKQCKVMNITSSNKLEYEFSFFQK